MPIYLSLPLFQVAMIGVVFLAICTARPWVGARMARLSARGRATREWVFVYTGRAFARQHAKFALSRGIWLTTLVVALIPFAWWHVAGDRPVSHLVWGGWFYWLMILALLMRWPFAYPLRFMCLATGLPFTAPLMVYWADGERPNLIYRHRYERLI